MLSRCVRQQSAIGRRVPRGHGARRRWPCRFVAPPSGALMPDQHRRFVFDAVFDAAQPAVPPAVHIGEVIDAAAQREVRELVLPFADQDALGTARRVEIVEGCLGVVVVPAGNGIERGIDRRGIGAPRHVVIERCGVPAEGQGFEPVQAFAPNSRPAPVGIAVERRHQRLQDHHRTPTRLGPTTPAGSHEA